MQTVGIGDVHGILCGVAFARWKLRAAPPRNTSVPFMLLLRVFALQTFWDVVTLDMIVMIGTCDQPCQPTTKYIQLDTLSVAKHIHDDATNRLSMLQDTR